MKIKLKTFKNTLMKTEFSTEIHKCLYPLTETRIPISNVNLFPASSTKLDFSTEFCFLLFNNLSLVCCKDFLLHGI